MSLKPLSGIRRSIGFRLTIWYSSILAGSFLVLFAFTYMYFASMIRDYDRSIINWELDEFVAQFQMHGEDGLRREVALHRHVSGVNSLFVRLAGPQRETLFLNIPDERTRADFALFENGHVDADKKWFPFHQGSFSFGIATHRFADGRIIQVGQSIERSEKLLTQFHIQSGVVILSVIVLSFIGGILLTSRTLKPLRRFVETLHSITVTGRMDVRALTSQAGDELDELATLFNALLEKIKRLIAGMQGSLDTISHDLRTPLMRLRGSAEAALRSEANQEALRETLMDILEESDHINSMLNTLMDISEADAGVMKLNLTEVRLSNLIDEVTDLYRYVAEEREIRIQTSCGEGIHVIVDPIRMKQVLANLLDNALKYTPRGGLVDITASQNSSEIVIVVSDTGPGISREELPRIWDRLYRGDESRSQRGLGLGLSLVKAIVQSHKGTVDVSSAPGAGSRFSISLPVTVQSSSSGKSGTAKLTNL